MKYHVKYTLLLSLIGTLAAPFALAANENNAGQKATKAALAAEIAAREAADGRLQNQIATTPGPQGPQGNTGAVGVTGDTGASGPQGPQGNTGAAGADGRNGVDGVAGANGAVGPQGDTGATGSQGPQGNTGAVGVTGSTGAVGPQGPQGAAGANGANGDTGATGAAGINGVDGADGANGRDGISAIKGTNYFQMQYWDGYSWLTTDSPDPDITSKQVLTFENGEFSWESTTLYYEVGDTGPAGGIVFHVTHGGTRGLEVAREDFGNGNVKWGCPGYDINTSTEIGSGAQNTAAIIALGDACYDGRDSAAVIATSFFLDGFGDWFLPSSDELLLVRNTIPEIFGVAVDGFKYYWSSSQYSIYSAYFFAIHGDEYITSKGPRPEEDGVEGYTKDNPRSWIFYVRPVRAF
jgi:hypothetical protein